MARIKEIEILKGRTINTGNYNSAKFEVSLSALLEENERWQVAYEQLNKNIDVMVGDLETEIHKQ